MSLVWKLVRDAMKAGLFEISGTEPVKKNDEVIGTRYIMDNGSFSFIWRESESTTYTTELTAKGLRINHLSENPDIRVKRKK